LCDPEQRAAFDKQRAAKIAKEERFKQLDERNKDLLSSMLLFIMY
jgi:hypothetical protein